MVSKGLEKIQKLEQGKNLKVQEGDSTQMKIQKTLLRLSMQLLQMLVQQLEKLKILINLLLEKFKSLPLWNKGLKLLGSRNKPPLRRGRKKRSEDKRKQDD